MAPMLRQRWICRLCGREVSTAGPMPSPRYDDGCRSVIRGDQSFGEHAWDEGTQLVRRDNDPRKVVNIDITTGSETPAAPKA